MIGKIIYALTWPMSSLVLRVLRGPKKVRKAQKLQATDYLKARKG